MVFEIIGQFAVLIQPFQQFGMGNVARHDQRAGERKPRFNRMGAKACQNFAHWLVQINGNNIIFGLIR